MTEAPFSNRELKSMFNNLDTKLDEHTEVHEKILTQTTKTNGRVNKLERWQNTLMGGVGVLIFLFPFFMYYFSGILEEIKHSVERNSQAISEMR